MSKYIECARAIELLKEKSYELSLVRYNTGTFAGKIQHKETVIDMQTAVETLVEINGLDVSEHKKGNWQKDSDGLPVCPYCGGTALQRLHITVPGQIADVRLVKSPFCPWCGADLQEGKK